ncbi:MAG TPA: hypothetical protein PLJ48_03185, partial [Dermatophilaceae bacterium]|nr:hypothetical protein [Dermatophilaceae bacterium]
HGLGMDVPQQMQVIVDGQSLHGASSGSMPPGGWGDCAPGGSSGRGTLRSGDESLTLRANSVSGDVILLRAAAPAAGPSGSGDAGPQDRSPEVSPGGPQDAPARDEVRESSIDDEGQDTP